MSQLIFNRGILFCILYSIGSISSSFTIKVISKLFRFNFPTLILLIQQSLTFIVTSIILRYQKHRQIRLKKEDELTLNIEIPYNQLEYFQMIFIKRFRTFRSTLILTILFIFNQLAGIKGIENISIPIYLAIRRSLIFFVLVVSYIVGSQQKINKVQIFSIICISCGAILAGAQDFDDNYLGYFYVISNNFITSFLLQYQKNFSQQNKSIIEIINNCSINGIPITFLLCFFFNEFKDLPNYETKFTSQLLTLLVIIGFLGVYYQVVQFYCNKENSPFAVALTGNFRDIITTAISLFVFNDTKLNFFMIAGLFTSFFGAFLYTFSKIVEQRYQYMKLKQKEKVDSGYIVGKDKSGSGLEIELPESIV